MDKEVSFDYVFLSGHFPLLLDLLLTYLLPFDIHLLRKVCKKLWILINKNISCRKMLTSRKIMLSPTCYQLEVDPVSESMQLIKGKQSKDENLAGDYEIYQIGNQTECFILKILPSWMYDIYR